MQKRTDHSDRNRSRWLGWWERVGAKGNPESVYEALIANYAESQRSYHTVAHVSDCLDEFEGVRHLTQHAGPVEMALWYHDAVYDPKAKDNEERSAELAVEVARGARLPASFRQFVADLILATKHDSPPTTFEAKMVVDIDLSILGQSAAVFDEYERRIRQEYAWVPSPIFRMRRAGILRSFLKRDSIYSTDIFRTRYESAASENLERSLRQLSRSGHW